MGSISTRLVAETVSKNLAKPQNSLGGNIILKGLRRRNAVLEKNAVKLCKIQPHYNVLEVGFGPGIGIKHAYNLIKDGTGLVYGVEISEKVMKDALSSFKNEIKEGKVKLSLNSVTDMPFDKSSMDCILHCNCYYFWPDMDVAIKELQRVIKHDGILVTTMQYERLDDVIKKGFMKYGNTDKDRYMDSLERHGFVDVKYEDLTDESSGFQFQAITGKAKKDVK